MGLWCSARADHWGPCRPRSACAGALGRTRAGHPFLAERDTNGAWRKVTYGETSRAVNAIAQSLLDRKLPPGRAIMILAEKRNRSRPAGAGCNARGASRLRRSRRRTRA